MPSFKCSTKNRVFKADQLQQTIVIQRNANSRWVRARPGRWVSTLYSLTCISAASFVAVRLQTKDRSFWNKPIHVKIWPNVKAPHPDVSLNTELTDVLDIERVLEKLATNRATQKEWSKNLHHWNWTGSSLCANLQDTFLNCLLHRKVMCWCSVRFIINFLKPCYVLQCDLCVCLDFFDFFVNQPSGPSHSFCTVGFATNRYATAKFLYFAQLW